MDNRMNGGGDQEPSNEQLAGMPGFNPQQADRSGTETLRSQERDGDSDNAHAFDANSTAHSGGTEFHHLHGEEDSSSEVESNSRWDSDTDSSTDTSRDPSDQTSNWLAMRDRIMETVRSNPIPIALGIAGVAALLMSLRSSRTRRSD